MKIGVVIDKWKLSIFRKRFHESGVKFSEHKGLTDDTLLLRISCEFMADVQHVIEQANNECRKEKMI